MIKFLKKFFMYFLLPCFLLWLAGLIWYASKVNTPPADTETRTDAIIALTGGTERVAAAIALLREGRADRLLISGVNQAVDWNLLSRTIDEFPDDISDRITLGHIACDTRENALESKYWMEKNGYTTLRLVTASYHMPRSFSEFRNVMPDFVIIPHPVFPPSFKHEEWWKWPGTTALMASEYTKFLLVCLRHLIPFFPDTITPDDELMCER